MLGARIAALRRRMGMSQAELAGMVKVSASAIQIQNAPVPEPQW